MESFWSGTFAAALALMPAAVKAWLDRGLAARLDDPALPERLMAQGTRIAAATAISVALTVVFCGSHGFWSVPLLITALLAAGFPLRRLLGETWSLAAYLWFLARLLIAIQGFFVLLVLAPALTNHEGWTGWAAASVLATVLLAWNGWFANVLRAVLRTRPLDEPELSARFVELVAKTRLPMPRFDVVFVRGGVLPNAIALPSLSRSGVVFTDTLTTRFTPDEVTAICAHELAHLEQFDAPRLRRLRNSGVVLILLGCFLVPLARASGFEPGWPWHVGLAMVVLGYQAVLARHRQRDETSSDLRAVELTGNAEAMVRALIKLHVLVKLPRRWDQSVEAHASHPSLARRIKAIRNAGAPAAFELGDAAPLQAADESGRTVAFEADRVVWAEADGSTHALAYSRVVSLRVRPSGAAARLEAVDREGRRWALPLRAEDVGRAQSLLDTVDVRLGDAPPSGSSHPVTTILALLASLVAATAGQIVAALVLLAASFARAPQATAAAAGAAVAASIPLWGSDAGGLFGRSWVSPLVLLLAAIFFASIALRSGRTPPTGRTTAFAGALGALVVPWLLLVAMAGSDAAGLHYALREWPGVSVLLAALAGVCLMWPAAWARRTASGLATAAVAALAVGSTVFLDAIVGDAVLVPSRSPHGVQVAADAAAEVSVPSGTDTVSLSPDGRTVLASEGVEGRLRRFHVGSPGAALHTLTADDAQIIDAGMLVTLEQTGEAHIVRGVDVSDAPTTTWEMRLDGLTYADVATHGAGQWRVIGRDADRALVMVEGTRDGSVIHRGRWAHDTAAGWPVGRIGEAVLTVETAARRDLARTLGVQLIARPPRISATLWRVEGRERRLLVDSAFTLDCGESRGTMLCAAFDGSRTHVVAVDPATGAVSGVARLDTRLLVTEWEPGWLTGLTIGGEAVALELSRGVLARPEEPADGVIGSVSAAGRHLAVLTIGGDTSTVRVHDMGDLLTQR